jgi:hypothetical protein
MKNSSSVADTVNMVPPLLRNSPSPRGRCRMFAAVN